MSQLDLPRLLIVDDSKIVRISLIRHLKDHFQITEQGDGEAGWEALCSDETIKVVISDISMPKLDGYGFLQRIRASDVSRIAKIPVVMVSGDEDESAREKAKNLGASDFITKGIGTAELHSRVNSLLKLSLVEEKLEAHKAEQIKHPGTGAFTRHYIDEQIAKALSASTRYPTPLSLLTLHFDQFGALQARYGNNVANQLLARFAQILSTKIRREDSLGHFSDTELVIVSPHTPEDPCLAFAARLREAIQMANIAIGGKPLELSVSIGIANHPADDVTSGSELLQAAYDRMQMAIKSGGNRVTGCDGRQWVSPPAPSLDAALTLLKVRGPEHLKRHAGGLGMKVLPLLKLIDQELQLNLPLADVEQRVAQRARHEQEAR